MSRAANITAGDERRQVGMHMPPRPGSAERAAWARNPQLGYDCPWCTQPLLATVAGMEWWSVEVFHGRFHAARWKDAHSSALIESAITNGAVDWAWHEYRWGVVLEVAFTNERQWETFRALPSVRAALDAVPDPVNGLLVHRGRGGAAGRPVPRRPRPFAGADAIALPEPDPELVDTLLEGSAPLLLAFAEDRSNLRAG